MDSMLICLQVTKQTQGLGCARTKLGLAFSSTTLSGSCSPVCLAGAPCPALGEQACSGGVSESHRAPWDGSRKQE